MGYVKSCQRITSQKGIHRAGRGCVIMLLLCKLTMQLVNGRVKREQGLIPPNFHPALRCGLWTHHTRVIFGFFSSSLSDVFWLFTDHPPPAAPTPRKYCQESGAGGGGRWPPSCKRGHCRQMRWDATGGWRYSRGVLESLGSTWRAVPANLRVTNALVQPFWFWGHW